MAKIDRIGVVVLSALIVFSWVPIYQCAKKPVGAARKEDIPYIKCQVCEKLAHQLYQQVQDKQAQISPKKISEYEIIEISENVCNLKKQEADWVLKIDIVEQGDKLELVEHESEGQCNSKCKTIERACQEVMDYSDTDVAEYLYKKKPQIESLTHLLCNKLSKACTTKPPPVPKDRTPGEPFVPKSSKEAEMEKLMKSMEGMPGAPGMKMYSREDLMNNMGNFGNEDADEDDDDDEADFPSKLGNVLKERDRARSKSDWKQIITKKVVDTGEALKQHANKVTDRIQKWWKGKKASLKRKNSKSSKSEL
ncbi:hypothetical protein RHMOL_Rhmol03G0258300 [Rhododendron molle]|uniref:Uncharacterized protein n=1 Tax=Rhododendron molle TaxID=49168 RepID=A0ACC0PI92_RHOML|nr:hypothetical protein RHMOL_Rhmol03G0258300 [Rhododendron molle]